MRFCGDNHSRCCAWRDEYGVGRINQINFVGRNSPLRCVAFDGNKDACLQIGQVLPRINKNLANIFNNHPVFVYGNNLRCKFYLLFLLAFYERNDLEATFTLDIGNHIRLFDGVRQANLHLPHGFFEDVEGVAWK